MMSERWGKLIKLIHYANFRRSMDHLSFRRKFFIGQILPATLGLVIAFLVIFAIVQNRTLYTARKAAIDVNQQVTNTSDYIWLMTLSQVYVLNNDSDIINWLNSDRIQPNTLFEALIQQRLMRAKESNPLIWSIDAYNAAQDRFIQSEASPLPLSKIPDQRLARLLSSSHLTGQLFFPRQITETRSNRLVKTNVITAVIPSDSPGSALIINISVDNKHKYDYGNGSSIEQLFGNTLSVNRLGKLLIMDKKSTVFFDEFSGQFGRKINQLPYIVRILQSKAPAGSFTMHINHKKCLITFATSGYLGWKIITIIPYKSLLAEAYLLRNLFLLISILVCSLICGFSLFYSGNLIRPVNTLVQQAKKFLPNLPAQSNSGFDEIGTVSQALDTVATKAEVLRQEAETARARLQEELVKNLVMGIPFEEKDYFSIYQELGDMFSDPMMIAIYAPDTLPWQPQNYEKTFSPGLKFSEILGLTKEKVKEAFGPHFSCFSFITGLDQLAVVVSSTRLVEKDFVLEFKQSCREIQKWFRQKTNYSMTIGLGTIISDMEKTNESYEAALDAVSCRFKLGRGFLFDQDMVHLDQSDLIYPKEYEKLILDGLRVGSLSEVKEALSRFITAIIPYSDAEIMVAINQLVFASTRVIDEWTDTHKSGSSTNKRLIKRELDKLQTLDDITHYLMGWYQTNIEVFDLNRSRRRTDIVEKVKSLIVEKYNDPNLTLQKLAEAVCLSPSHLRALFRDTMGETLADYIAEYRLQKAAEMFIQTEKPVAEIAAAVGLSSANYFHSVFRRRFGVTPLEYRRANR